MYKIRHRFKVDILVIVDACLIIAAFCGAYILRFHSLQGIFEMFSVQMVLAAGAFLISFLIFDVYDFGVPFKSTQYFARLIVAVVFGGLLDIVFSYALPVWKIGRGLTFLNTGLIFLFVSVWRVFFEAFILGMMKLRSILILGAGSTGLNICDVIDENEDFSILGFIDDDIRKHGTMVHGFSVLGGSDMIRRLVDLGKVDAIVVAITHEKCAELLSQLMYAKLAGVDVFDAPTIYADLTGKLLVSHLSEDWFVFTSFKAMSRGVYIHVKRLSDIILALVGLVLAFPIIVLTAVLIKLSSRGPVFFRQKRVGLNDKVFMICKLRSMQIDAEKNGAVFAKINDDRITRIGKFLRKSRIDEIPQLWNILVGDMSFVGPRPERPEFVEGFKKQIPYYSMRHIVRPGLTGWAQVRWRYGASEEDAIEKLKYDAYYLKNISPVLDLQIILKTINVMVFQKSSR